MGLFRRKRTRPPALHTDELRRVARRLTGWTVTGTSGVNLPALLSDAADEIERLQELVDADQAETA